MNYFFKFLVPQLLEYFNDDRQILMEFIPKIIAENYKNELENITDIDNSKNRIN